MMMGWFRLWEKSAKIAGVWLFMIGYLVAEGVAASEGPGVRCHEIHRLSNAEPSRTGVAPHRLLEDEALHSIEIKSAKGDGSGSGRRNVRRARILEIK